MENEILILENQIVIMECMLFNPNTPNAYLKIIREQIVFTKARIRGLK